MSLKQTGRSDLWMLLGFFLGAIGAVIAYEILKKDDRDLARKCLYVGMASTVLWIAAPNAIDVPYGITMSEYTEGSAITNDADFGTGFAADGLPFEFAIDDTWDDVEPDSIANEELGEPEYPPAN